MINKQSVISGQQSAVSYLSFPRKRESSSLTSSLSSSGLTGGLTGQSRTKVLDSPIKSGNDRKKFRRNDYNFTVFNSSEAGFTLVELMITMVVFLLVIAAASQVFTGLLTQFKQQSKIAETNIEGIVGLEILRQDIEHAGYGLPCNGLISYSESSSNPFSLNDAPTGVPRPIVSGNDVTYSAPNDIFNGSDYLVIKSVNVARNDACEKWTTLSSASPYVRTWTPSTENLASSDRVIVLTPGTTDANARTLINDGSDFYTTFGSVTISPWPPPDMTETRIVYGINTSTANTPRRPFNRADYMIRRPTTNMPSRCAQNTGILYKATMNHDDSGNYNYLPLLDCVADMQVNFWLDTDNDGNINWPPSPVDDMGPTGLNLTAQQIREQLKEVRIYIVAHEGQRDINYDFSMNNIREALSALEVLGGNSRTITFVNLKNLVGDPEYKYYRWKVYTLVVKPNNLR